MCAKHYENPTMLSRVTAKNTGDVFFETHCIFRIFESQEINLLFFILFIFFCVLYTVQCLRERENARLYAGTIDPCS